MNTSRIDVNKILTYSEVISLISNKVFGTYKNYITYNLDSYYIAGMNYKRITNINELNKNNTYYLYI